MIKEVVELNNASRFNTQAVIAFSPELIDGYHDKRHDWYDMHVYAFVTMEPGTKLTAEQLNTLITQHVPRLMAHHLSLAPKNLFSYLHATSLIFITTIRCLMK